MVRLSRWLVCCVVCVMIVTPLSWVDAQETPAPDEHPLMEMLGMVPNTAYIRAGRPDEPLIYAPWVAFVDYRAALEADPYFPPPADFAEFAAQVEQGREQWMLAPGRVATEPELPYLWNGTGEGRDPKTFKRAGPLVGEVMEELTGMDYFDIHTGMSIGRPPMRGLIFGGDLDLAAIGAAHVARDYIESTVQGLPLWCSGKFEDGCENPTAYDAKGIEGYNVFDYKLGRQPPFLGVEGSSANYIVGALDYDLLLSIADAVSDSSDSLADAKDYRTLAHALIDTERYTGALIQAYLFPGPVTSTPLGSIALVLPTIPPGAELVEPVEWADYGTLPAYHLMALADRQEGDDVVTMVALLYPDPADAEVALPELVTRLTTYTSTLQWGPGEPMLGRLNGNPALRDSYVYIDPETGWAVAVVTLRNDLVYTVEESGEEVANNNVMYQFYFRDIVSQVFYPLWVADFTDWTAWEN